MKLTEKQPTQPTYTTFTHALTRVREWLAPPVFPGEEEKNRIAALLNVILLVILGLVVTYGVISEILVPSWVRLIETVVFAVIVLGLRVLLYEGRVRLAGALLTMALWVPITAGIYAFGGLQGSGLSSYFGIVLIAGLLLGGWAAVSFAGLSILASLGMLLAENAGVLPPPPVEMTPASVWLEFTATLIGVTGLLVLADRNLKRALARARRHEEALRHKAAETQQLAQQALEANAFKSRLIARTSHELRTPLGAIRGLTEMLYYTTCGPLTPEQKKITQKVIRHSEHLEELIGELLEQSRLESGKVRLVEVPFAPSNIALSVKAAYLPLAQEKGLALNVDIAENLPAILLGDPKKIEQILTSLVSNAIKFTSEGAVHLRLHRPDADVWSITVTDTGVGIPEDALGTIFEPFRQVDESITRQHGGVGLGLALVKEWVTLMDGEVTVESDVGQGSTFTVRLPLKVAHGEGPECLNTAAAQGVP